MTGSNVRRALLRQTPGAAGPSRWLVIGHFRGDNVGDQAMLTGLVRGAPEEQFVVSTDGALPTESLNTSQIPRGVGSELRALSDVRGVLFCGGTHLHENYDGKRQAYHLISIARYSVIVWAARLLGLEVHFVGIGVERLHRPLSVLSARLLLASANGITTRDAASTESIAALTKRPVMRAFDLALLAAAPDNASAPTPAQRVLGFVPMASASGSSGPAAVDYWRRMVVEVAGQLEVNTVRLLVFASGGVDGDEVFASKVAAALTTQTALNIEVASFGDDADAALATVAGCTWLVATRYHSAVFAYATGVPFVVLKYHDKLDSLARDLGAGSDVLLPAGAVAPDIAKSLLNLGDPPMGGWTLDRDTARHRARGNLAFAAENREAR
jgi:polysaccharide pyruvyl transferase WcaK-like protein